MAVILCGHVDEGRGAMGATEIHRREAVLAEAARRSRRRAVGRAGRRAAAIRAAAALRLAASMGSHRDRS